MLELFVIRGPSGTGKSSIAAHLGGEALVNWFETDMYLYDDQGKYFWTPERIKMALDSLRRDIRAAFRRKHEVVICSTVTTKLHQLRPLEHMAVQHGYAVKIIRTPRPWDPDVLFRRNKHNVPLDIIHKHIGNYQPHPEETEWSDLSIFHE